MSTKNSNRDWEKQPYGVEDGSLFEKFEADLIDELEKDKGVGLILWNTEAADEIGWYEKLMSFEHKRALRKEGDKYFTQNGDVEEELEQESDETPAELETERKDLAKQVAERYYQFKLRDFTSESRATNFKKLDNMVAVVKEARFDLYYKLKNWTAGTVRDEIIRLGKTQVEFARGKMAELFGKQTYDDTAQLIDQLKKGIVKVKTNSDGSVTHFAMAERDNVVTYFTELEKLRSKILQRMDKADQSTYEPCLWPSMVLHARQGLHCSYLRILQNLTMFGGSSTAVAADSNARVLNVEEDYRRVDYDSFKRACVRQWADNAKIWKKGGNTLPIFRMHGEVQSYDTRSHQTIPCATNPMGEIAPSGSCWSCKRSDCRATSDSCALKGTPQQYAFAPPHIKQNYVGGGGETKTRECIFYLKGTCNHGENCKFAHSGQPSFGSGAVRQPFGKGKGRFGKAKNGKPYKSAETAARAKVQSLTAQASRKQKEKKTKRKVSDSDDVAKIFLAGVEAAKKKQNTAGDGSGSSVATPPSDGIDSQIQQLIDQHCMMIRVHEDVRGTLPVSKKKQKSAMSSTLDRISATVLFAGMDDGSSVCLDTGSGVHATSFKRDPIFLNTSADALEGIGLGGVGGSASLIGRAAFILPLKELLVPNKHGEFDKWTDGWLATGDKESALYMKPPPKGQIRVVSADALEQNGLVLRCGVGIENRSYLVCKKSGCMIPVHTENGIKVIKTRKESPSNIQGNVHLDGWLKGLPSLLHYTSNGAGSKGFQDVIKKEKVSVARVGKQSINFPPLSSIYKAGIATLIGDVETALFLKAESTKILGKQTEKISLAFTEEHDVKELANAQDRVSMLIGNAVESWDFEEGVSVAKDTSGEVSNLGVFTLQLGTSQGTPIKKNHEPDWTEINQNSTLDTTDLSSFVAVPIDSEVALNLDLQLQKLDREAIDLAWQDLQCEREHQFIDMDLYIKMTQKPSIFVHEINVLFNVLVMNPHKLPAQQRARLWHWRLAHCADGVPKRMTKDLGAKGMNVTCDLNEDCPICDKAKFRRAAFYKPNPKDSTRVDKWMITHVDGVGGQKSFKVKSIHGAVGSWVFADDGTNSMLNRLYRTKDQFKFHLRNFFIMVAMAHKVCRRMIVDGDASLINDSNQAICAEFGCVMLPCSPGTPQENRKAERAARQSLELCRAMMQGAPHLPACSWGCAITYGDHVHEVLPSHSAKYDFMSPYQLTRGIEVNFDRIPLFVFGAFCQWSELAEGQKPENKQDERTRDGCFVGVEYPSALILECGSNVIRRISLRKIRVHETAYCKEPVRSKAHLKELMTKMFDEEMQEFHALKPVQSIQSLRQAKESLTDAQEMSKYVSSEQGGVLSDTPIKIVENEKDGVYVPDYARVEELQETVSKLLKEVKKLKSKKPLGTELSKLLSPVDMKDPKHWQENMKGDSKRNHDDSLGEAKVGEDQKIADVPDLKLKSKKKFLKILPVNKAPVGTEVRIKTTRFDTDKQKPKYSEGKAVWTFGKIQRQSAGDTVWVLWDDDKFPVKSHFSHLEYRTKAIETKVTDDFNQQLQLLVMEVTSESDNDSAAFYMSLALVASDGDSNLARKLEPYKTLATLCKRTSNREKYLSDEYKEWKYP